MTDATVAVGKFGIIPEPAVLIHRAGEAKIGPAFTAIANERAPEGQTRYQVSPLRQPSCTASPCDWHTFHPKFFNKYDLLFLREDERFENRPQRRVGATAPSNNLAQLLDSLLSNWARRARFLRSRG
jgi:hypothetical protein